jgi:hypothetical protein
MGVGARFRRKLLSNPHAHRAKPPPDPEDIAQPQPLLGMHLRSCGSHRRFLFRAHADRQIVPSLALGIVPNGSHNGPTGQTGTDFAHEPATSKSALPLDFRRAIVILFRCWLTAACFDTLKRRADHARPTGRLAVRSGRRATPHKVLRFDNRQPFNNPAPSRRGSVFLGVTKPLSSLPTENSQGSEQTNSFVKFAVCAMLSLSSEGFRRMRVGNRHAGCAAAPGYEAPPVPSAWAGLLDDSHPYPYNEAIPPGKD